MGLDLYTVDRAPKTLPVWQLILTDLGNPNPIRVAKVLGVGLRTVYRWNASGSAPRAACMALFWLTRWGRSEVDAAAVNDARLACALVTALENQVRELRLQVDSTIRVSNGREIENS